MNQRNNNITYKLKIHANVTNMVAILMVLIERIVIQSVWLKSGNNWINATHNDDVKYTCMIYIWKMVICILL